eukprot:7949190-Pyramimonas_sp.AAC.1
MSRPTRLPWTKKLYGRRATNDRWHQWAGAVRRGAPSSLVLFKTIPRTTKVRSPGPGPNTRK